jgi:hypothetical protein
METFPTDSRSRPPKLHDPGPPNLHDPGTVCARNQAHPPSLSTWCHHPSGRNSASPGCRDTVTHCAVTCLHHSRSTHCVNRHRFEFLLTHLHPENTMYKATSIYRGMEVAATSVYAHGCCSKSGFANGRWWDASPPSDIRRRVYLRAVLLKCCIQCT